MAVTPEFLESIDVALAVDAVREAAQMVRRVQRQLVTPAIAKDDKSPVTVADFAAQALVARRLAERFPGSALVGEESSKALRQLEASQSLEQVVRFVAECEPSATAEDVCRWIDLGAVEPPENYWTLDPVDGTKGFLRNDQYAVAFALVEGGRPTIGVLGCPELEAGHRSVRGGVGTIAVAARGEGAYWQPLDGSGNWTKLSVSTVADPRAMRLLRSVEKAHTSLGGIEELVRRLEIAAPSVAMDSQAKYAVLAAGGGEAMVRLLSPDRPDYREKVWDQAAGSLVIEEAGGRVTDLAGQPLDFSQGRTLARNRGVLASNGRLHEALLAGLKAIRA
jgi:3'(2'), 5'-bisphosphate nucleotidase